MRKRGKKRIKKLKIQDDLYEHFGETKKDPTGFSQHFNSTVTDSDIQKAAIEKRIHPEEKPASLELRLSSYPPPQTEIDLHGMTSESAERKIRTFLWRAATEQIKTIRIITGKGLHSDGPAVLPGVTETVLKEMKLSGTILHYQWKNKVKQRSGSVIVFLK